MTTTNGLSSMEEHKPLEPGRRETTALVTNSVQVSESTLLLTSDHILVPTRTRSDGTQPQERTSRTTEESALISTVDQTLITDTSSSTTATTV